jgi:hypothetical protein
MARRKKARVDDKTIKTACEIIDMSVKEIKNITTRIVKNEMAEDDASKLSYLLTIEKNIESLLQTDGNLARTHQQIRVSTQQLIEIKKGNTNNGNKQILVNIEKEET